MCQLSPEKAKYWKEKAKKPNNFFWRQLPLKKPNLWILASKKPNWQSWLEVNIWKFVAVILLRNKGREYNNPLASFAPCLCWQRSELRTCTKRLGGVAVTTLPGCPDGPRVHLSGLVVCVQKSDFHLINVFCVVIVKKCRLLCLAQVVFSYFVLQSSKTPLVLPTKVTHLRSLLFRQ